MSQNEPYLRPMSTVARTGNVALLMVGIVILFFEICSALITWPSTWAYLSRSQLETTFAINMAFFGIGGFLLYFWWKTRPTEGDN